MDHERSVPPELTRPLPEDVARQLSWLAHLIDERITVRGVGSGVHGFVSGFLGTHDIRVTTHDLGGLTRQLVTLTLAADIEQAAEVRGAEAYDSPSFETLDLGDERVRVPRAVAAAFPAGTLAQSPLVVILEDDWRGDSVLAIHSATAEVDAAKTYLEDLLGRARANNPFRGQVLEARVVDGSALAFRVLDLPPVDRADVVLPSRVWDDIDTNVHGLFAARQTLTAAGLPANRGVLLAGPPGTGKTLLCRALASEVPDGVTVIFCDAAAVAASVRALYRELAYLAPALVVMEDLDLVVGDRHRDGKGKPLVDFLLALDGATSEHQGVATVATTNDVNGIDAAAKRSARFDRIVDVPPPDQAGRAAILRRYLGGTDVDCDAVAAVTDGATGADLREVVTRAVLRSAAGRELTTDLMVRLARESGGRPAAGQYL
jgi:cell division protease FtsH